MATIGLQGHVTFAMVARLDSIDGATVPDEPPERKPWGLFRVKRSRLRRSGKRRERALEAAQKWRAEVLLRAGYRCERCGSRSRLQAHHRIPRQLCRKSQIWNADFGAALCGGPGGCHDEVHQGAKDRAQWIWRSR